MEEEEEEEEKKKNAYRILVGKHKGKRPLVRSRRWGWILLRWFWTDNIRWCGLDYSGSV
jgi:hypothetical protein